MPALPLTYNLELLKEWAAKAGIAMWSQPSAKNSVAYRGRAGVLPQRHLLAGLSHRREVFAGFHVERAAQRRTRCELVPRTLVRRLVLDPTGEEHHARRRRRSRPAGRAGRVPREAFVVAAGYTWSAHLLLLSAQRGAETASRTARGWSASISPDIATCSGYVDLPLRLYPGMNEQHSLVTKQFMRRTASDRYHSPRPAHLGVVGRQDAASRGRRRRR